MVCNGRNKMAENITNQDWRSGKSAGNIQRWSISRAVYMLDHKIGCDIKFIVGPNGDKLDARKFVLISNSAVFESMLCGDYLEKHQSEIEIDDIQTDIFRMFLRALYSYAIPADLSIDDAFHLLYVAKKYCVEWLVGCVNEECLKPKVKELGKPPDVCVTLEKTHQYKLYDDDGTSKKMVIKYIHEHGEEVLKSSGFKKLCPECVADVIQSDDLWADEEVVYSEVKAWAEEECRRQGLSLSDENKRTVLGSLLYLIRFPTMKRQFFADIVARENLLLDSEKIEIFCQLTGTPSFEQNQGFFSMTPRINELVPKIKTGPGSFLHGAHKLFG